GASLDDYRGAFVDHDGELLHVFGREAKTRRWSLRLLAFLTRLAMAVKSMAWHADDNPMISRFVTRVSEGYRLVFAPSHLIAHYPGMLAPWLRLRLRFLRRLFLRKDRELRKETAFIEQHHLVLLPI